jgi:hypothetical protein
MSCRHAKIQEGEGLLQRSMSGPPLSSEKPGCFACGLRRIIVFAAENNPVDLAKGWLATDLDMVFRNVTFSVTLVAVLSHPVFLEYFVHPEGWIDLADPVQLRNSSAVSDRVRANTETIRSSESRCGAPRAHPNPND